MLISCSSTLTSTKPSRASDLALFKSPASLLTTPLLSSSEYFIDNFITPLGPLSQFMKSSFDPVLIVADKRLNDQILTSKDWDRGDLMEGIFGGVTPKGMLAIKTGTPASLSFDTTQCREAYRNGWIDVTLRLHRKALAPVSLLSLGVGPPLANSVLIRCVSLVHVPQVFGHRSRQLCDPHEPAAFTLDAPTGARHAL